MGKFKRYALKARGKAILAIIATLSVALGACGSSKKGDDVHPLYGAPDSASIQLK